MVPGSIKMAEKITKFIGRRTELAALRQLLEKRTASLVTIKGRRRIGKSRLIKEFAKEHTFYAFSGLPPTPNTTAQSQRDEFARQLSRKFDLPTLKAEDWGDLFSFLAKRTNEGRVIILFDEISWMGNLDHDFLGKLKNIWDLEFSDNPHLILILCGSVSSWIEKNIINSTGFFGRTTLNINLNELSISESNQFWNKFGTGVSAYEKFKILSVTGGIPRYLELINPKLSAEENIRSLCFTKQGPLSEEFERIFIDIFGKKSPHYRNIIEKLVDGPHEQIELAQKLNISLTGELGESLNDLLLAGFITRDYTWQIKTGKISKYSQYRLKDNYLRFYLKYILPNKSKIEKNIFQDKTITSLPGWDIIMGLQFENLVANNHIEIIKMLGINTSDLVFDNPFYQKPTNRQKGCQIDYLIQTRFNTVYICEIKFHRFEIGISIIDSIQEKINRIKLPKNFSYRPVLIHVNGVREDVVDSGFFAHILDFGMLLG